MADEGATDSGDQILDPRNLKQMQKIEVMQMEKGRFVCKYEAVKEMIAKLEAEINVLKMEKKELACKNEATIDKVIKLEAEFDVAKRENSDLARENERLQNDLIEENKKLIKSRRELDMFTEIDMTKSEQLDVSKKVRDLHQKRIDELEWNVSDDILEIAGKDSEIEKLKRCNEDLELVVVRQALQLARMRSG